MSPQGENMLSDGQIQILWHKIEKGANFSAF